MCECAECVTHGLGLAVAVKGTGHRATGCWCHFSGNGVLCYISGCLLGTQAHRWVGCPLGGAGTFISWRLLRGQ